MPNEQNQVNQFVERAAYMAELYTQVDSASKKNIEEAQNAYFKGININIPDSQLLNAAMYLGKKRNWEAFKFLKRYGAKEIFYFAGLCLAGPKIRDFGKKFTEVERLFLARYSAMAGNAELTRYFLSCFSFNKPNKLNDKGQCDLADFAAFGGHEDLTYELMNKVTKPNRNFRSAASFAAHGGHIELAKKLFKEIKDPSDDDYIAVAKATVITSIDYAEEMLLNVNMDTKYLLVATSAAYMGSIEKANYFLGKNQLPLMPYMYLSLACQGAAAGHLDVVIYYIKKAIELGECDIKTIGKSNIAAMAAIKGHQNIAEWVMRISPANQHNFQNLAIEAKKGGFEQDSEYFMTLHMQQVSALEADNPAQSAKASDTGVQENTNNSNTNQEVKEKDIKQKEVAKEKERKEKAKKAKEEKKKEKKEFKKREIVESKKDDCCICVKRIRTNISLSILQLSKLAQLTDFRDKLVILEDAVNRLESQLDTKNVDLDELLSLEEQLEKHKKDSVQVLESIEDLLKAEKAEKEKRESQHKAVVVDDAAIEKRHQDKLNQACHDKVITIKAKLRKCHELIAKINELQGYCKDLNVAHDDIDAEIFAVQKQLKENEFESVEFDDGKEYSIADKKLLVQAEETISDALIKLTKIEGQKLEEPLDRFVNGQISKLKDLVARIKEFDEIYKQYLKNNQSDENFSKKFEAFKKRLSNLYNKYVNKTQLEFPYDQIMTFSDAILEYNAEFDDIKHEFEDVKRQADVLKQNAVTALFAKMQIANGQNLYNEKIAELSHELNEYLKKYGNTTEPEYQDVLITLMNYKVMMLCELMPKVLSQHNGKSNLLNLKLEKLNRVRNFSLHNPLSFNERTAVVLEYARLFAQLNTKILSPSTLESLLNQIAKVKRQTLDYKIADSQLLTDCANDRWDRYRSAYLMSGMNITGLRNRDQEWVNDGQQAFIIAYLELINFYKNNGLYVESSNNQLRNQAFHVPFDNNPEDKLFSLLPHENESINKLLMIDDVQEYLNKLHKRFIAKKAINVAQTNILIPMYHALTTQNGTANVNNNNANADERMMNQGNNHR